MSGSRRAILIAVLLGALAGLGLWGVVRTETNKAQKGWVPLPVLVAAQDLPEGTVVKTEMLATRTMPEQFVTPSLVPPESVSYVTEQKLLVPLLEGDPILWSHFAVTQGFDGLSQMLPKKARAMAVGVDAVISVGNWIQPNDHVDVLGTFRDPVSREIVGITLLQNVVVLATGKRVAASTGAKGKENKKRDYNSVTLLVLPEEAEILNLAGELGKLNFSLRNPEDLSVMETKGRATINTLLTGERIQELRKTKTHSMGIIRGQAAQDPLPDPAPKKERRGKKKRRGKRRRR